MLFTGLIKCSNCNHTFKGRQERNQINYRCNNRLKNGVDSCSNNSSINEEELKFMIKQQFDLYDIEYNEDNTYLKMLIKEIIVEPNNEYKIYFNSSKLLPTINTKRETRFGYKNKFDEMVYSNGVQQI